MTNNKLNDEDGIKFINIWKMAKTDLGRFLAQYSYTPFTHPVFGAFNSMEGFWHYVGTVDDTSKRDTLRGYSGDKAKKIGATLTRGKITNFRQIILMANFYKIECNPEMKKLFIESELPFENYYLHNPKVIGDNVDVPGVVIRPKHYAKVIEDITNLRDMMKQGKKPPEPDYKQVKLETVRN